MNALRQLIAGPLLATWCHPERPRLGNQAAVWQTPHRTTIAAVGRRGDHVRPLTVTAGALLLSAMAIVIQGPRRVGLPIGQWQTYVQPRQRECT